jgi:hypothetical protein
MKNEKSMFSLVNLAIAGVSAGGIYLLWRNRFKIQESLQARGISTPWMKGSTSDALQSGYAKVAGEVEHGVKSLTRAAGEAKDHVKAEAKKEGIAF